jgi:amino acid permease
MVIKSLRSKGKSIEINKLNRITAFIRNRIMAITGPPRVSIMPRMLGLRVATIQVVASISFLGHYLGAREGFNGMVIKSLRSKGKSIEINKLKTFTRAQIMAEKRFGDGDNGDNRGHPGN